jgi:hypothetical protein
MTQQPIPQLIVALPKARDMECHVRVMHVGGLRVVELRDYIPSLSEYGRGFWIPADEGNIQHLIDALITIENAE